MLNPELKLNSKLFNEDVEKISNREGFGKGLLKAGEENKNVVALCADLTESVNMHLFAEKFSKENRFIEVGVAEQNLVTTASGMAAMGKIPFCGSYAIFSPGRNWEQIRTTICYNNQPVKIIGSHAGVSVGPDGGSHQMLEDIALMRVLPNMEVFSPCDAIEAKKITLAISKTNKPSYLRLNRDKTAIITTEETPFEIGKSEIFWLPEVGVAQVGIIATGALLYNTILAAKELEAEGIKTKVLNLASVKPIDSDAVIKLAKETKCLVTVEEHQVAGGIGSLISEVLAQVYPTPIEFVGLKDKFGQSGTAKELIEHYELGKDAIKNAVKKVLNRKV
jgi:transketolase